MIGRSVAFLTLAVAAVPGVAAMVSAQAGAHAGGQAAAQAGADTPAEGEQAAGATSAGWTLTPSIGVSSLWDDNPTLASEGDVRLGDYVTAVRPNLGAGFRGPRTAFTLGYGGQFDFYRTLTEQNTHDHRGSIDFSQRLSRRVTLFARDQAMLSPTTGDAAELGATVLRRQTTRMNAFRGGFDAALARHTTLTAAYSTQWIDFETGEGDTATAQLEGGHSHGGSGKLRQQLSPRVALGADYEVQRALIGETDALFDVQSVLGVTELALAPHLDASVAYGHAWLFAGDGVRRNGPAVRLGLEWQGRRAIGTLQYARAFLPSFGFGGTFQNHEVRGSLNVPLSRLVTWGGGLVAAQSDPLTEGDPSLRTLSVQSQLAVTVKRRLRLEAFGTHVFQDSTGAGGRVHRTRAGVQASIATPVRAR